MTLKLVTDNTNVAEFPRLNVGDLPTMVRALADDLDGEFYGDVLSLVTLVVKPDGIAILSYGENCSPYELMGLFEAAKFRVLADDLITDDD